MKRQEELGKKNKGSRSGNEWKVAEEWQNYMKLKLIYAGTSSKIGKIKNSSSLHWILFITVHLLLQPADIFMMQASPKVHQTPLSSFTHPIFLRCSHQVIQCLSGLPLILCPSMASIPSMLLVHLSSFSLAMCAVIFHLFDVTLTLTSSNPVGSPTQVFLLVSFNFTFNIFLSDLLSVFISLTCIRLSLLY